MTSTEPIIQIEHLCTRFGDDVVHRDVNLTVEKGEVLGIVGGSGSGKTTLLRQMMALNHPSSGSIRVFGVDINAVSPEELLKIQQRFGVLFQQNALFSSLNVLENTGFPLREHTVLDTNTIDALSLLKILMAGLPSDAAIKFPSELSGGMQKRAGIARAIIQDPELIFLDEPTAGLDPNTAAEFDQLILDLQSTMGLTIVIVTHDLDTLWTITDRVAFLGDGVVLAVDSMKNLVKNPHPKIQAFFSGPRGRVVQEIYQGASSDGHKN